MLKSPLVKVAEPRTYMLASSLRSLEREMPPYAGSIIRTLMLPSIFVFRLKFCFNRKMFYPCPTFLKLDDDNSSATRKQIQKFSNVDDPNEYHFIVDLFRVFYAKLQAYNRGRFCPQNIGLGPRRQS